MSESSLPPGVIEMLPSSPHQAGGIWGGEGRGGRLNGEENQLGQLRASASR